MRTRSLMLAFGLIFLVIAGAAAAQNSSTGFLGVRLQDGDEGVVIREIVADSPASAALQVDDVITAINGEAVSTAADVAALVQAAAPGDTLTLTITRAGESVDVDVELGSAPPSSMEPGRGNDNRGGGDNQPPIQMLETAIIYNPAEEVWEVRMLTEGTPLYEAGLRQGDVVTVFNGEPEDMMTLRDLVAQSAADEMITLTVQREGAEQAIEVPASALTNFYAPMHLEGNLPVDPRFVMPGGFMMASYGRLGVAFVTLNEQTAAENDVEFVEGALITEVAADSPAEQASVAVGDVVTAVNGEPVDQERTLRDRISAYEPGDVVTLTVLRSGESTDIEVTLGEQDAHSFMIQPGMELPGFRFNIVPPEEQATPEAGLMPEATVVPGV